MNITRDWRIIRDLKREIQDVIDDPQNDFDVPDAVWQGLARVLLSTIFKLDGATVERLLEVASLFSSWGKEWREWRESQKPAEPEAKPPEFFANLGQAFVNFKNSSL